MKPVVVAVMLGAFAALVYFFWVRYRAWAERQRASEQRFAGLIDQVRPPAAGVAPPAPPDPTLAQQKLLLEAASKAGEAGEAVLSIQLYARLLARYPQTAFGTQARAAVEAQKKKLVKR
jgi:hypothetical protein